ncbi:ABC transporter substrate-binding protein [Neobacillus sp. NPDC097160]|uniref:ABC transporter substrate-binding protein n=1 Tax=Neobacillus sp. NPDC097160 TaxID=3364298 RepID=UPI00382B1EB9
MRKYRIFLIVSALLMLTIAMLGCTNSSSGSSEKEEGDKIQLSFFHRFADGANKQYFDSVVKEFEKQNPNVKIKISSAINDDYKQKINVLLGSSNPPDIFFAWSGEYAQKFVRGGKALDLTQYTKEGTELSKQVVTSQFGPYTFNEKVYGVPIIMDGKAFFYNKEIFKKLNLEVPATWNDFIGTLKIIKENNITPIAFGNQSNWAVGHYLTTLNQRIVDPTVLKNDYDRSKGEFTNQGYVDALNKIQELEPYFTQEPNAVTDDSAINAFVNGKAAIYYNQFNQIPYIKPAKFEWSWFNFPGIEVGKGDPKELTGASQGFMVSSKTRNPDMAIKFLNFLTSKNEAEKMVKETGMVSSSIGAVNENSADDKMIEVVETINQATGMNVWLDTALDSKIVDVYLNGAQQMMNKEKTAEEVMKEVQNAAKKVRESTE